MHDPPDDVVSLLYVEYPGEHCLSVPPVLLAGMKKQGQVPEHCPCRLGGGVFPEAAASAGGPRVYSPQGSVGPCVVGALVLWAPF